MKTIVLKTTIIAFLLVHFTCYGQNRNSIRQPIAAGTFYPATNSELNSQLEELFNAVENKTVTENISAIIVPDDKMMNTGLITASAIAQLNRDKQFARIFVIGTAHNESFKGISVDNKGDYRTSAGIVRVDNEVVHRLLYNNRAIKHARRAHKNEHSIEVQLPYLQYWLTNPFKIVPMVIGSVTKEKLELLAEILKPYFTPDNLFIISSDISKFAFNSNSIKNAITGNSVDQLFEIVSPTATNGYKSSVVPTGWNSVLAMLSVTSGNENISVESVKNISNADNELLGYHSYIIRNETETTDVNINLSQEDMQFLLQLVRNTIEQKLEDNTTPTVNENELSENLKIKCGAFVTLTKDGELRGNMGKFTGNEPLYKVVQEMALASAFRDIRYIPIGNNEMNEIDIEISVITPLKQIFSSDEIQMGKHGIYMTKDGRSGSFLPQTARATGWSKKEFLGYCAEDIAGIGWEGWKIADLYTFETFVFDRRTAFRRQ